jgi:hypothetical protein
MRVRRRQSGESVYEIFSDMALLMLAAFIFLFALILITSELQGRGKSKETVDEIENLKHQVTALQSRNEELQKEMNQLAGADIGKQMEKVLASAGWGDGQGRRDFELFVEGLRKLPGRDLHLVVDATGSMHGATTFLIPVLRVIALRSGKRLSAVSWYGDKHTGTYTGTMGEMFDNLMKDAPFVGTDETVGHAFRDIARNAPVPGAYLLIGDEPPSDKVYYSQIPAPVFTLPLASSDSSTKVAFQRIADNTGGRLLELKFR